MVPDESREETCQKLVDEWAQLEISYAQGVSTGPARWVVRRPARFPISVFSGGRLLVMTPEPATRQMWSAASANRRNAKFC